MTLALLLLCTIYSASTQTITSWENVTLPTPSGFSGGMTAYNSSSGEITIIGQAYWKFNTYTNKFQVKNYTKLIQRCAYLQWIIQHEGYFTNGYVQIGDKIYFLIANYHATLIYAFSLILETCTLLSTLPLRSDYEPDPPCLAKSNDNIFLFILGGTDMPSNTFYIYDIQNDVTTQGTNLSWAISESGCFTHSNDILYVIPFGYSETAYQIWAISVANIDDLINGSAKWNVLHAKLPGWPISPFVTGINDLLYVIGGQDCIGDNTAKHVNYIQISNSSHDVISGPSIPSPYALFYPAAILANGTVYLFTGSWSSNGAEPQATWIKSTNEPTHEPTHNPSNIPSTIPTISPSKFPTITPTKLPSNLPSKTPSKFPTNTPSNTPTNLPSNEPTNDPSMSPTNDPSITPTNTPSNTPTNLPSNEPTNDPSMPPTNDPSIAPTNLPSHSPTLMPSKSPVVIIIEKEGTYGIVYIIIGVLLTLVIGGLIFLTKRCLKKRNHGEQLIGHDGNEGDEENVQIEPMRLNTMSDVEGNNVLVTEYNE